MLYLRFFVFVSSLKLIYSKHLVLIHLIRNCFYSSFIELFVETSLNQNHYQSGFDNSNAHNSTSSITRRNISFSVQHRVIKVRLYFNFLTHSIFGGEENLLSLANCAKALNIKFFTMRVMHF